MKKLILALALSVTLFSCSSDEGDVPGPDPIADFAMTAKLNGTTFQANNPFNGSQFSNTNIYDYYPMEDFVLLQGRQGGILGNPEINLWLKRSDIALGTYPIGEETYDTPPSHHIDLIDNLTDGFETTAGGSVTITEVNTTTKIVKGTFQFTTLQDADSPEIPPFNVTEGNFRYVYE
ncbi:MAG TPA: DUF6252 family protein [Flavobacterium sp.]|jgi:hypothetical protein